MKKAHQKLHRAIWLLLLPLLAVIVLYALDGRFLIADIYGESQINVEGKELP